jgi:hypothetical protein
VLSIEPISENVGVGDVVTDVGMISGVDPQPIATTITQTVEAPSIDLEFMPEYDAAFGDEQAEDLADD